METNELKNIWIEMEGILTPKTKNELKEILLSKTKKILSKFRWFLMTSILLCIGVITFLIIASLKLKSDILYLLNNTVVALIIIALLVYYIKSYKKLYFNVSEDYNVYRSLNNKVQFLSKELKTKFEIILIPVLGILLILSVNVFYTSRNLLGTFQDKENLWGLIFGFSIGMLIAFYFARKISKYQKKELRILQNYLKELESI